MWNRGHMVEFHTNLIALILDSKGFHLEKDILKISSQSSTIQKVHQDRIFSFPRDSAYNVKKITPSKEENQILPQPVLIRIEIHQTVRTGFQSDTKNPNPIWRLKRRLQFIWQTDTHPQYAVGLDPFSSFVFSFRTVGVMSCMLVRSVHASFSSPILGTFQKVSPVFLGRLFPLFSKTSFVWVFLFFKFVFKKT